MSDLSTAQLATLVKKAKLYMQIEDDDPTFEADGIAVFCTDGNTSAATVQVTDTTVVLTIVDGAGAATTTLTLADTANDTLSELATVIDGTTGWTANLVGNGDATSTLLKRLAATGCLTQANEQTLKYENEELLELLITNIWRGIETSLDRGLLSTAYSEVYDIGDNGDIVLNQPNVTQVQMTASGTQNGLTVKYTGTDTHARVEVTDTAVVTVSRVGVTTTTTTSLFSANAQTSDMATTINALSGWTATVEDTVPSAFLVRSPVQDCKDREVTLEAWDDDGGGFEVDYAAGVLRLYRPSGSGFRYSNWPSGSRMRVDYTAGDTDPPDDVSQAVIEAVKVSFDAGKRSAGLQSEKIGDYAYTLANVAMATADSAARDAAVKLRTKYARILV